MCYSSYLDRALRMLDIPIPLLLLPLPLPHPSLSLSLSLLLHVSSVSVSYVCMCVCVYRQMEESEEKIVDYGDDNDLLEHLIKCEIEEVYKYQNNLMKLETKKYLNDYDYLPKGCQVSPATTEVGTVYEDVSKWDDKKRETFTFKPRKWDLNNFGFGGDLPSKNALEVDQRIVQEMRARAQRSVRSP